MITKKIQSVFDFIDFLDANKTKFIEKYLPLCSEVEILDKQRSLLNPNTNYKDKQQYDIIQEKIKEKLALLQTNIYLPFTNKLLKLGIWSGDQTYASIWNNNISEISDFKRDFALEDVEQVMYYKYKYISFRVETNSNFLCLGMMLQDLDEIFKFLFDFFKDTTKNEFEGFEGQVIEAESLEEAIRHLAENKGKNIKLSIPFENLSNKPSKTSSPNYHTNIKHEIHMGDNIIVGDISNNSGQINIGKNIRIADNINGRKATADKIDELISLIRQEPNIEDQQRQSLITNFDKVKEEIAEDKPDTSKIFKWLTTTKGILENLVLTHHVTEAAQWVFENLNFVIHHIPR